MMNLRQQRYKAGLTVTDVAKKLNIRQNSYSRYEHGHRRIPVDILPKLAMLYGCTIDDLFGVESETQSDAKGGTSDGDTAA